MKPGDLRRWNYPEEMPASFNGAEIFMVLEVRDGRTDFLIDGKSVRLWSTNWIYKHSEPLNETR